MNECYETFETSALQGRGAGASDDAFLSPITRPTMGIAIRGPGLAGVGFESPR